MFGSNLTGLQIDKSRGRAVPWQILKIVYEMEFEIALFLSLLIMVILIVSIVAALILNALYERDRKKYEQEIKQCKNYGKGKEAEETKETRG